MPGLSFIIQNRYIGIATGSAANNLDPTVIRTRELSLAVVCMPLYLRKPKAVKRRPPVLQGFQLTSSISWLLIVDMGRFQDHLSSQQGWLHELARAEVHPDAEKLLQLGSSFDPQLLVEESTINFLTVLKEEFQEHSRIFNSFSEKGSKFQEIKVYSVAQTAADFMLFRNQIKLVFSNSAHGVVQIAFAQHARGSLERNNQPSSQQVPLGGQTQELHVQLGPFRDVYWTFRGEKVDAPQIAKFYFAEFARITRDNKPSKLGNQLLLDQIKALLQEKGLDL